MKQISRQRAHYWARILDGNCGKCGQPRNGDSERLCTSCAQKDREYQRKRHGFKEWQQGKPGKPPLNAKQIIGNEK